MDGLIVALITGLYVNNLIIWYRLGRIEQKVDLLNGRRGKKRK